MIHGNPNPCCPTAAPQRETLTKNSYAPSVPRYIHNPQLYLEELEQYHAQCKQRQVARSTKKLLILVLLLLAANLCVLAWYLLRYNGILP